MIKIIHICVIIATIALVILWLHFFLTGEPIPLPIIFLLVAAIFWFLGHLHMQNQQALKRRPEEKSKSGEYGSSDDHSSSDSSGPSNGFEDFFQSNGYEDFQDIFESFFNVGNKEDCHQEVKISRSEALQGCVKSLRYKIRKYCDDCSGTGVGDGGSSTPCAACNGKGSISVQRKTILGVITSVTPCKTCNGMGVIIKEPCGRCKGKGFWEALEQHDISIPANCSKQSIEVSGKGHYIDKDNRGKLIVNLKYTKRRF